MCRKVRTVSRLAPVILALAATCSLLSCSVTPADRIRENPTLYASLTPKQQQAVKSGQLEIGMSTAAVYLAMGAPSGSGERADANGLREQVWFYSSMQPVAVVPRAYYCYPYGGPYLGDDWVYRRRLDAVVYFRQGKVVGWERNVPGSSIPFSSYVSYGPSFVL